jgi:hypothetical protein
MKRSYLTAAARAVTWLRRHYEPRHADEPCHRAPRPARLTLVNALGQLGTLHLALYSIDMYNNDVGKKSAINL